MSTVQVQTMPSVSDLVDDYHAKGGMITVPRKQLTPARIATGHYCEMSRELLRRRKIKGFLTAEEWEANARSQFAAADAEYRYRHDETRIDLGEGSTWIVPAPRAQ